MFLAGHNLPSIAAFHAETPDSRLGCARHFTPTGTCKPGSLPKMLQRGREADKGLHAVDYFYYHVWRIVILRYNKLKCKKVV